MLSISLAGNVKSWCFSPCPYTVFMYAFFSPPPFKESFLSSFCFLVDQSARKHDGSLTLAGRGLRGVYGELFLFVASFKQCSAAYLFFSEGSLKLHTPLIYCHREPAFSVLALDQEYMSDGCGPPTAAVFGISPALPLY